MHSLVRTRLGFDNAVLLEHKEGSGPRGLIGLSKEFDLHSADLIGSRNVTSLGLGYGESPPRSGIGNGGTDMTSVGETSVEAVV